MECSVIVPIHNEAGVLPFLQARLAGVLRRLPATSEVIYVDDASTDRSGEILSGFQRECSFVRVISLETRGGQTEALRKGLEASRGRWVATLDADLQNPPEEILKLWREKEGFDYVAGSRRRRQDPWSRRLGSCLAFVVRFIVLSDRIRDAGCSLKVFKKDVFDEFPFSRNFHCFMSSWVQCRGFRYKVVPVEHHPRFAGRSKYSLFLMMTQGWRDLAKFYRFRKSYLEHRNRIFAGYLS